MTTYRRAWLVAGFTLASLFTPPLLRRILEQAIGAPTLPVIWRRGWLLAHCCSVELAPVMWNITISVWPITRMGWAVAKHALRVVRPNLHNS
jgi:hypothetical protein